MIGVDEMVIVKLMLKKYGIGISAVLVGNIYSMVWGYLLYCIGISTVWYVDGMRISTIGYGDIYCME